VVLDEGLGGEGALGKCLTSNFVASDMAGYMASELIVDDDLGYVGRFV